MPPGQDPDTAPVFRLQSAADLTLFLDFDDGVHLSIEHENKAQPTRQMFRFWRSGQIQNVLLQGDDLDGGYLTRHPGSKAGTTIVTLVARRGEDQQQKWNTKPGRLRDTDSGAVDAVFTLIVTPQIQDGILEALKANEDAQVVGWVPYAEWDPDKANAVPLTRSWNCFRVA